MKTNHKKLLGKVLAPVALSGIIWSLNTQRPVQAQNTGLAAPPRIEQGGPADGSGRGGPRDGRGPRGPRREADGEGFGPPPPGPSGAGPDDERGPRGHGPREGGPRERGPEARGPRGKGPREGGPGGPRGRRPGGRGNEIDEAGHVIGDVDIFPKLTGDAFNVSGQARAFYRRALNSQQAGDRANAAKYGRVSSELAHAALRLAEAQTGKRLPELRGDGPREGRPRPDAVREKERASHVLNDAYRALGETSGQWNATARRLYAQARNEFNAGQYEKAHGHAAAAMHLAEAGRSTASHE